MENVDSNVEVQKTYSSCLKTNNATDNIEREELPPNRCWAEEAEALNESESTLNIMKMISELSEQVSLLDSKIDNLIDNNGYSYSQNWETSFDTFDTNDNNVIVEYSNNKASIRGRKENYGRLQQKHLNMLRKRYGVKIYVPWNDSSRFITVEGGTFTVVCQASLHIIETLKRNDLYYKR